MIKAHALRCFEHGDLRVLCQDGGFETSQLIISHYGLGRIPRYTYDLL